MQTRIYRFEIVRAKLNGIYEARDTDNNASVTLYEWTPAPADRAPAKLRLSEIQGQLHGAVFTADASLYLIAPSPQAAEEPLKTLHSHNLFLGIERDGPPATPPIKPHADDPPIVVTKNDLKPPAAKAASSEATWGWIILIIICGALAFYIGESVGDTTAKSKPAPSENSDLSYKVYSLQEQLDKFSDVHLLRINNSTSAGVYVAVMYKNWASVWVFSGWQGIAPYQTVVVAASPAADFYYTAYAASDHAVWHGDNEKDAYPVPGNSFTYYPFRGQRPAGSRTKLFHVTGDLSTLTR